MTIDDILTAFKAGTVTQAQATKQLQQQQDDAVAAAVADDRYDRYAMAALTGILANGEKWPSKGEVVRECYSYAEWMQKGKARLG